MAISWRLKTFLAQKRGIYRPTEFQKRVRIKTGVLISLQNLSNYMKKRPTQIRLETMNIICSALGCHLSDFLEVSPSELKKPEGINKLSYQNTPKSKRTTESFPDPKLYE